MAAYIGAGGGVLRMDILERCGHKPAPAELSDGMRAALRAHCVDGPSLTGSRAFESWFVDYADDSPLIGKAKKECERLYAEASARRAKARLAEIQAQAEARRQAAAARKKAAAAKMRHAPKSGIAVLRVYASSSISSAILVETAQRRRVKCGVYDADGNLLDVRAAIVTPPVDKVTLIHNNPGAVVIGKCWH